MGDRGQRHRTGNTVNSAPQDHKTASKCLVVNNSEGALRRRLPRRHRMQPFAHYAGFNPRSGYMCTMLETLICHPISGLAQQRCRALLVR